MDPLVGPAQADVEAALTCFYAAFNVAKLDSVTVLYKTYAGREVALFHQLHHKYRLPPPPATPSPGDAAGWSGWFLQLMQVYRERRDSARPGIVVDDGSADAGMDGSAGGETLDNGASFDFLPPPLMSSDDTAVSTNFESSGFGVIATDDTAHAYEGVVSELQKVHGHLQPLSNAIANRAHTSSSAPVPETAPVAGATSLPVTFSASDPLSGGSLPLDCAIQHIDTESRAGAMAGASTEAAGIAAQKAAFDKLCLEQAQADVAQQAQPDHSDRHQHIIPPVSDQLCGASLDATALENTSEDDNFDGDSMQRHDQRSQSSRSSAHVPESGDCSDGKTRGGGRGGKWWSRAKEAAGHVQERAAVWRRTRSKASSLDRAESLADFWSDGAADDRASSSSDDAEDGGADNDRRDLKRGAQNVVKVKPEGCEQTTSEADDEAEAIADEREDESEERWRMLAALDPFGFVEHIADPNDGHGQLESAAALSTVPASSLPATDTAKAAAAASTAVTAVLRERQHRAHSIVRALSLLDGAETSGKPVTARDLLLRMYPCGAPREVLHATAFRGLPDPADEKAALKVEADEGGELVGATRGVYWRILLDYIPSSPRPVLREKRRRRAASNAAAHVNAAAAAAAAVAGKGIEQSAGSAPAVSTKDVDSMGILECWHELLAEQRELYASYRREFVDAFVEAQKAKNGGATPRNGEGNVPKRTLLMRAEDGLKQDSNGRWGFEDTDAEVADEIRRDTERTHPTMAFFKNDATLESIEIVLFIFAKLNPGVRYVQGMNELLAPIFYVFATDPEPAWSEHAEADAFFCFSTLMAEVRDHFIQELDQADGGLSAKLRKTERLLSRLDPELASFLQQQDLQFELFALRWVTTLLSREFSLPDTIHLWDALLADPRRFELLHYVCVAMMSTSGVRDKLMGGDFAQNITLLQHLTPILETTIGVQKLLSQACVWYEEDVKARARSTRDAKREARLRRRQMREKRRQRRQRQQRWRRANPVAAGRRLQRWRSWNAGRTDSTTATGAATASNTSISTATPPASPAVTSPALPQFVQTDEEAVHEAHRMRQDVCRRELEILYERYNPAKLASIDEFLQKYAGSESELVNAVRLKYEPHGLRVRGKVELGLCSGGKQQDQGPSESKSLQDAARC